MISMAISKMTKKTISAGINMYNIVLFKSFEPWSAKNHTKIQKVPKTQ